MFSLGLYSSPVSENRCRDGRKSASDYQLCAVKETGPQDHTQKLKVCMRKKLSPRKIQMVEEAEFGQLSKICVFQADMILITTFLDSLYDEYATNKEKMKPSKEKKSNNQGWGGQHPCRHFVSLRKYIVVTRLFAGFLV
ncbi:hypothetical protein C5167_018460 [Papaver somniferum]|uniref:Uncharacterized protein n=1 Tax=Papaver somniferum TaxID=3469 RepID=A0A4Y7IRC3_PAPSO|nr:hypothetical protein C5167_018460 [Papaver somniferum]